MECSYLLRTLNEAMISILSFSSVSLHSGSGSGTFSPKRLAISSSSKYVITGDNFEEDCSFKLSDDDSDIELIEEDEWEFSVSELEYDERESPELISMSEFDEHEFFSIIWVFKILRFDS